MSLNVNRETKIGIGVLLGLLIVFSVVLVRRLSGLPPAPTTAAAKTSDADEKAEATASDDSDSRQRSHDWGAKPTLLKPHHHARDEGPSHERSASYEPPALPAAPTPTSDDRYGGTNDPRQTASALMQASTAVLQVSAASAGTASPQPAAIVPAPAADAAVSMAANTAAPAAPAALPPAPLPVPQPVPQPATYGSTSPYGNAPATVAGPTYVAAPAYGSTSPSTPASVGDGVAPASNYTPRRDDGMYEVQPSDNYYIISQRLYGTPAYFKALAEHNRGKAARPDRLPPGLVIAAPPAAQLEQTYPDLCPKPARRETMRSRTGAVSPAGFSGRGRTYTVQEGDTLSSIARHELGKVSRWSEIYELNRDALGKDYDYLTPGMQLSLPGKASAAAERTARGGTGYSR